jgi:NAD(P)-dependent dehydrogenase (short-subunit alcohol dehydrogenase family)
LKDGGAVAVKVALVTGAGTGVGAAAARALAADGYSLVLAGRRGAPLTAVADSIRGADRGVLALPADVSDPESVERLFSQLEASFGRLDLLFNNAGRRTPAAPVEELSLAEWKLALDVNVTGMFLCTQHAVRLMKRQVPSGGRIINNGSLSAYVPRPHSAAYAASKHAVLGLTKATALDCRRYGIACGQIDIGNADTPMTSRMKNGVLQADGSMASEPVIDADHVGRAIAYLAGLPLDVNVLNMTVMAAGMPYIGRG